MDIDIEGLVADGHLKLDNICNDWDWKTLQHIADYTRDSAFDYQQSARQGEVWLQCAKVYGFTIYRWVAELAGPLPPNADTTKQECGTPSISREEVVDDGHLWAEKNHSPITNPYNECYYHAGVIISKTCVKWSDAIHETAAEAEVEARELAEIHQGQGVVEYWDRSHGLYPGDCDAVQGSYTLS